MRSLFRIRSISQTLSAGSTIGLVMLLALSTTSLLSLYRYNRAIDDLDYAVNRMPRKAHLAYQFGRLFHPLQLTPTTAAARSAQQQEVQSIILEVQREVEDYRRKVEQIPLSQTKLHGDGLANYYLSRLERYLREMKQISSGLGRSESHEGAQRLLTERLASVYGTIEALPQLRDMVRVPLARSLRQYRNLFRIITAITVSAVCLYLSLVYFGHRWISQPIQQMVRGARRVAQRDFDYRIQMQSPEELVELANALNCMTNRFQEAESELEQQVEERSRQLFRTERLADVGFIAAGVSHEINNPLHAIMGAAEALQSRLPELAEQAPEEELAPVREYLGMIRQQSQRCSRITAMLKDFARRSDEGRQATDMISIIDEVLLMVGHLSKYRDRQIVFDRDESAVIEVNPSQMQQVVLNLVSNALESMDQGGRLEIRIVPQTDFVVLEFADDGCGMSDEVRQNLFEPFFTQRRNGGGTGLGLSITDRIVKEHDGTIEVFSDGPGQGSLFRVRLPRRAARSDAA